MLFDPHTGFIAIDEFDAGFFQGVLDRLDGARLQCFASLQSRDCRRRDLGHDSEIAHSEVERGPSHPTLGAIYEHGVMF
jgi:hypothetical protein